MERGKIKKEHIRMKRSFFSFHKYYQFPYISFFFSPKIKQLLSFLRPSEQRDDGS